MIVDEMEIIEEDYLMVSEVAWDYLHLDQVIRLVSQSEHIG